MDVPALAAGAVAGAVLQYLLIRFADHTRSRRSEMHGRWYEVLDPYQDLPERWDVIDLQQTGNEFWGTCRRIKPSAESARQWTIRGYVHGRHLVALFYINNTAEDPASYGTIVLCRDLKPRNRAVWFGQYTRPEFTTEDSYRRGPLPSGHMRWQRRDPRHEVHREDGRR